MNFLDENVNFVELEENVLSEVNGGLPWKLIGKYAWKAGKFAAGVAVDVLLSDAEEVH